MSFVHLIIHFIISYFLHLVTFQLLEERQDFIDTISKTNYYHTFYLTLCYLIYLLALSLLICLVTLHNDITFPVLLELKQSKKKKKYFGSELLSAVFITNELESNVGQRVI